MSCQPSFVVKPAMTDFKFKFARGTRVRVFTKFDGTVEGTVAGHLQQVDPKILELEYAIRITKSTENNNEVRTPASFVRIYADQVYSVEILDGVKLTRKIEKEAIHHTVVVSKHEQFKRLMSELKDVKKVALNLYGTFVGRLGKVSWVALFFSQTLVCIDVLELATPTNGFWDTLGDQLFSNEKIQKVIFSTTPIQDYLYHVHCIMLKNVFDIQVSELYIWMQDKGKEQLKSFQNRVTYNKLSLVLETFLKKKEAIPESELELLKDFEMEDFTHESPLSTRPITDEKKYCKCVAIEMKYLLSLKSELHRIMLSKYYSAVNAQLEEMVNESNGCAETKLKIPDSVPVKVFQRLSKPTGHLVKVNVAHANGKN